jgi:hypothetical protein
MLVYNNNPSSGDDWLRQERLAPECEPRGADLDNSAQKIKCQPHFLRRYAPRCLIRSRELTGPSLRGRRSPLPFPSRRVSGRQNGGVPRLKVTQDAKEGLRA